MIGVPRSMAGGIPLSSTNRGCFPGCPKWIRPIKKGAEKPLGLALVVFMVGISTVIKAKKLDYVVWVTGTSLHLISLRCAAVGRRSAAEPCRSEG